MWSLQFENIKHFYIYRSHVIVIAYIYRSHVKLIVY
jgi:hypothetical protein